MITYLTQLTICWTILFGVYYMFLKRETFFVYNRWFLLAGLVLGMVIPLIDWAALISHEAESIGHIYVAPVQTQVHQWDISVATSDQTPLWYLIVTGIYSLGVAVTAIKLIKAVYEILSLQSGAEISRENGYRLVLTNQTHMPFSFLNAVYWSRELYRNSGDKERILAHEARHVSAMHSLDILFIEIVCVLFWFHPMVYIYRKEIKEVHEYEADAAACVIGNKKAYGQLLLNQANSDLQLALANHFFYSQLKNRFKMMTRKPSSRTALLKYLIAIPIIGLAALVFSFVNKDILPTQPETTQMDTFPLNKDQIDIKLLRNDTGKSDQPPERKMEGKFHAINSTGNKPLIELRYSRLNTSGETSKNKDMAVVHFSLENNGTFSDGKLINSTNSKIGREAIGVLQMTETIQGPRITRLREGKEVSFRYAFTEGVWLGDNHLLSVERIYPNQKFVEEMTDKMDEAYVIIDKKPMGVMNPKEAIGQISSDEIYRISNQKTGRIIKKYNIKEGMSVLEIMSKSWADDHPDKVRRGFKTVVGKVVDMEGQPIVGANVMIKDGQSGTATDFNGEYRLMGVDKNNELIFSSTDGSNAQVIPMASQTLNDAIVQFPTVTLTPSTNVVEEIVEGSVVQVLPRFPGCENLNGSTNKKTICAEKKFLEYLYGNIGYPTIARKNNIQGQVIATFTIKKNGTVDDVHIIKDPGARLGDEVEQLLEDMNSQGKWTPALKEGQPVNFQMTIPVVFKLKGENINPVIEKVSMDNTVNPLSEITVVALSEAASQPKKTKQDAKQKMPNVLDEITVVGYGNTKGEVEDQTEVKSNRKGINIIPVGEAPALIVLDGYIIGRADGSQNVKHVDPDNIESITVLKGEKAIEKYGDQGKSGVIIITTKDPVMKSVEATLNLHNFNLYPNPASNELSVDFEGPSGAYRLEVLDVKGAVQSRKDIHNEDHTRAVMNISALHSGVYYLKITSDSKVIVKAFVKE